jgi:4-hydroxybenzoate polyprenyltransferase
VTEEMPRDINTPNKKIGTEDILAIGAVIVAIIIAIGIVFQTVDVVQGGTIIIALVGAAGIAQVIKAKRRRKQ